MNLPSDIGLRVGDLDSVSLEGARRWLSERERRRLRAYGSRDRARQFLLGRTLAREVLADRLGLSAEEIEVETTAEGAPRLGGYSNGEEPVRLSIAHSGSRAAVVVSPDPVGVDVEEIKPRRSDLYRRFLREDEYEILERFGSDVGTEASGRSGDPTEFPDGNEVAQIVCWTLKEAALKAMGTGLGVSPLTLRIDVRGEKGVRVVDRTSDAIWTVRFERREGYILSVAYPEDEGPERTVV